MKNLLSMGCFQALRVPCPDVSPPFALLAPAWAAQALCRPPRSAGHPPSAPSLCRTLGAGPSMSELWLSVFRGPSRGSQGTPRDFPPMCLVGQARPDGVVSATWVSHRHMPGDALSLSLLPPLTRLPAGEGVVPVVLSEWEMEPTVPGVPGEEVQASGMRYLG